MKKLSLATSLVLVGLFCARSSQATIAPSTAVSYRNDSYFLEQWGLVNQNQTVIHDLDDIHSDPTIGVTGMDIDWLKSIQTIESKMIRDVVVAVVDYGVDLEQPELKDAILKNDAECLPGGRLPPAGGADKDGNGFAGDCMGWNFATHDAKGDNRPYDDEGHGTHIAGIMAAKSGNAMGVAGMSSRIKILPVRVTTLDERSMKIPLTQRIASGINYAVSRGVDVINLSMGYPRSFDSVPVRNAVINATKHGVFIVAAAGNNGNPATVEPCSYEGVICVGAITNKGELASFSNYGGDVDILAPGDTILSTIPLTVDTQFFSVSGYDYKDGTSQAAPYVSGTLALLRGAYPNASMSELKARLMAGTRAAAPSLAREQQPVGGLVQLSNSFNLSPRITLLPMWKGIDEIEVNPDTLSFEIPIGVENLWTGAPAVQVSYQIDDARASLDAQVQNFGYLQAAQVQRFSIRGHLTDVTGDSRGILKLKIAYVGADGKQVTSEFWREIHWIMAYQSARWVHKPFVHSLNPVADARGTALVSSLGTVDDPFRVGLEPDYKIFKVLPNAQTQLRIFKLTDSGMQELPNAFVHANVQQTLGLIKIHSPANPHLAYLWSVANTGQFVEYCYLGSDLQGNCLRYDVDTVIAPANAAWVDFDLGQKTIPAPVFVAQAALPKSCTNPNPWVNQDKTYKNRLFYLEPIRSGQETRYKVDCVTSDQLKAAIAPQMKLSWNEDVIPLSILAAEPSDAENRIVKVLVTAGNGSRAQNFILTLDHFKIGAFLPLKGQGIPLDLTTPKEFTNLGDPALVGNFLGLDAEGTSARSSLLDVAGNVTTDYYHRAPSEDPFFGVAGVFGDRTSLTTAIETKKTLQIFTHDRESGAVAQFERPLIRFSFLSGSALSENYYPVEFLDANKKIPAFYVDGTNISNKAINLLEVKPAGIFQPTSFQVEVPVGCLTMNPVHSLGLGGMAMTLLCKTEGSTVTAPEWEMRYLPLISQ